MRIYKVDLTIIGPLTIEQPIIFDTDKELSLGDIFKSKININSTSYGLEISTTVFTNDTDAACSVALVFVGKMLDILSIKTNLPYYVTNKEIKNKQDRTTVRTIIAKNEFDRCFELT
jgi:hypothetical protein